ncbi:SMC family ATPase [Frondihabitans cladoniiphilus]|uniref:Nuclease SbcCD subunit C n=1 Tax=Frondihabitans cladoniiphilus TaxID=715785 RepID=A0ABP8W320_9MICO
MQLHRLTLRAIGPYAAEQTIDFGALGRSGLFLLEGPTGSGKSTIIDAMVFALYGVQAGEGASTDRLHSHHAARGVEPFVELVFETGAGIHRVRRSPAWWRPKSRGDGVTRANASATLVRLATPEAADGEVLSTSAQEVGGEIARILGLTRQQFVQTVVLPQGEFAKFLGATGEERRLVLQSLFGTEIYEKTTQALVERRKAAHASVVAADRAVDEAMVRLREASDVPDLEPTAVDELVARLTTSDVAARADRETAQSTATAARSRQTTERALEAALARRLSLLSEKVALDGRAADIDASRRRLELGRRAASLQGPIAEARAAAATLASAVEKYDAVLRAHPSHAGRSRDEVAALRDQALGDLATLRPLVALEAGLDGRALALAGAREALETLSGRIDEAEAAAAERPGARPPLVDALATASAAVRDIADAERAVTAATALVAEVEVFERLREGVVAAQEGRAFAADEARAAVEAEAELRRRRIDGMAGELARGLRAGDACPVCGSVAHPTLAVTTAEHPDDEAIEKAEAERTRADAALARASEAAAHASARRDAAAAALGGHDGETAAALLASARTDLDTARGSAAEEGEARAALAAFDAATEAARTDLAALREQRSREVARAESDSESLEADRRRVAEAVGERAVGCAELVAVVDDERAAVEAVLEATAALETARSADTSRRAAVASALIEAGFDTAGDAEAAALDASALETLDRDIAGFDAQRAVVASGLAAPEVASLTGDETTDLAAADLEVTAAESLLEEATIGAGRTTDRLARTRAARSALERAEEVALDVAAEARAAVRMADVATAVDGQNLRGVTLGTYVLLRRFDDVVAAANARLGVMSSGRYLLEAAERETGARSRKVGLALAIRDNTTDTTRDPKSFSGGETFYASLSLALGLADVVQSESGGLDLGTLFVDEGFGTLDPETLDAVMTELGRLSAHGRVVGIVSHVEELKQRIADRIEVRRLPDGSSTLRSTAG